MAKSRYQRRHYEDTAGIIRRYRAEGLPSGELDACAALAGRFADLYAADNPQFDRERFLEACRIGAEG